MKYYSIVIPHKNTPELLQRCIDSIPLRDDVEIIVVDNNSSPEIVDFEHFPGYKRKDVKIIKDNDSISGGGARNAGLSHATGKWLLFADADDYYTTGFLDVLDKYKDSNTDVVFFDFQYMNNGLIQKLPKSLRYLNNKDILSTQYIELLRYKYAVPWNKMVKRELVTNNEIYFEDCVVGNDILYSLLVGYYGNFFVFEPSKIYNYIINQGSTIHKRKNSEDFYHCIFVHLYQCNEFRRFVNHSEWSRSVYLKLLAIIMRRGLLQGLLALKVFLFNYKSIYDNRFGFVDKLKII